jgi:NAD(P)-dependent dehydrogenase (short-subunit alcohol dehydrogenase family)
MGVRLDDKVALVTGASRGVGKGVALALADAGATVYVTGRSVEGGEPTTSLPGTIEETAEQGGTNVRAVRCDHRNDGEVRAVFDQIEHESGGLDVLVDNVWGGYALLHEGRYETFGAPFWEAPLELWGGMFSAGVRAHFVASTLAVPLMLGRRRGLIVNVSSFAAANPKEVVPLGVAKAATDRLSALTAEQLREHGIAVVSLYPGLVRTEGVLKWADYLDLTNSESPSFVGRAVAALAADPDVIERTGTVQVVAELAEEYGFSDEDGGQPRSLRSHYEVAG